MLLKNVFPDRLEGPKMLGPKAVENCLKRRGYKRYVAYRKPILTAAYRTYRLA